MSSKMCKILVNKVSMDYQGCRWPTWDRFIDEFEWDAVSNVLNNKSYRGKYYVQHSDSSHRYSRLAKAELSWLTSSNVVTAADLKVPYKHKIKDYWGGGNITTKWLQIDPAVIATAKVNVALAKAAGTFDVLPLGAVIITGEVWNSTELRSDWDLKDQLLIDATHRHVEIHTVEEAHVCEWCGELSDKPLTNAHYRKINCKNARVTKELKDDGYVIHRLDGDHESEYEHRYDINGNIYVRKAISDAIQMWQNSGEVTHIKGVRMPFKKWMQLLDLPKPTHLKFKENVCALPGCGAGIVGIGQKSLRIISHEISTGLCAAHSHKFVDILTKMEKYDNLFGDE